MLRLSLFLMVCLLPVLAGSAHAVPPFQTLSDASTPLVAYAVDYEGTTLSVRVRVGAFVKGQLAPHVHLGISAVQTSIVTEKQAEIITGGGGWTYVFTFENVRFSSPQEAQFRWAMMVEWVDAEGESLQRQNYFTPPNWPSFLDIGTDASAWAMFNLAKYNSMLERLAQRIAFEVNLPVDGKASVVIENSAGQRVRNLISGQSMTAGSHELVWDGMNEDGALAEPAEYRWRAISHPGIKPELMMYFYAPGERPWAQHTWLADHSNPTSAAAYGEHVVLGAPVAESGNNIILADLEGNKITSANLSSFIGLGHLFLALGPDRIYALNEGSPGYNSVREDDDGKKYVYGDLTLVSWDYSGVQQRYKGTNGEHVVIAYKKPLSEGSGWRKDRLKLTLNNLRGAVYLDGLLYLSLHDEDRVLIINARSGAEAGAISIPAPGAIATDGRRLYVLGESDLFQVTSPADGASATRLFSYKLSDPQPVPEGIAIPPVATSMAISAQGELYIADNGVDQNIKVFNRSGKMLRELGKRGGRAASGPWKPNEIRQPYGIAIDARDRLWLAENEEAPKRISTWDTTTGRVIKEIFGPTPYGGSGAGFDPQDATIWIGGGCVWKLDFKTKQATLQSVLHHQTKPGELADIVDGHNVRTIHQDGRTFLIAKGRYIQVFEKLPDGSARLWAMLGSLSAIQAASPRFSVPEVFTRHPLLKDELADFIKPAGKFGDLRQNEKSSKNARDYTVLWIDVNGDGIAQVEELQVTGAGPALSIPYWATISPDLNLGFLIQDGQQWSRGTLQLHGYLPSGAPDWRLAETYEQAVPLQNFTATAPQATMLDGQGRLLLNSTPMVGVSPDGTVQWTMRNDWLGVHGSHQAPLPRTGVMQGNLAFLGDAPFDDEGEITVLNGNHGRFFALTSDGIYLDEFFHDVRVALESSAYRIGGEAFGGYFAQDAKTGRYILQAGHGAYRIYELKGLDRLIRSSGTLQVTPEQIIAAQRLHEAQSVKGVAKKSTVLRTVTERLPDSPEDWPGEWAAEWGEASRPFPHVRVKMLRDGPMLKLAYEVKDPSPWINQGTNRNLLFKTGDAVDFQFSTDPSARADRSAPVVGDRRLLIANYGDRPAAILYDYRVPGIRDPVQFNSPWRSAVVDRVTELPAALVTVRKHSKGYTLVASVPLASLGLPTGALDQPLKVDFGVIYGDEDSDSNILRSYWSNSSTGLVNDVPGETMINPELWGELHVE